ncbi:MAG: histone deacetylase, partial [Pseudomonadota bacterium]
GYCIFNDFALAANHLITEKRVERVAIVDLDVHQGDGNASLLKNNPHVFVLSLHGEKNYPFRKFESDHDIGLPDFCDDQTYIEQLHRGLSAVDAFRPDIVLFQAGVDILELDKLGRLNISYQGLWQRDLLVLGHFKEQGIPVSMAIGGGYSDPIEHSVKGYIQTYLAAKEVHGF